MQNAFLNIPVPKNEPVLQYQPGSSEKLALKQKIAALKGQVMDIPAWIGGKGIRTGKTSSCVCPHDHQHVLANYHRCGKPEVEMAIQNALNVRKSWAAMPLEGRASIFIKAAELLSGPWRATLNAANMLNASKTDFCGKGSSKDKAGRF